MTTTLQSKSRIRKAFYALTQHKETLAHIILDTRRLAIAYSILLIFGTLTLIVATTTLGYELLTTGVTASVIGIGVVTIILASVLPNKFSLVSLASGSLGIAIQLSQAVPSISIGVLHSTIIAGVIVTSIPAIYLTRHTIIIGSQLWDELMRPDGTK